MHWDRIEAEWLEMACRVSGNGGPPAAVSMLRGREARPDDGPAGEPADTVALPAVDAPDRIVA